MIRNIPDRNILSCLHCPHLLCAPNENNAGIWMRCDHLAISDSTSTGLAKDEIDILERWFIEECNLKVVS